MSQCFTRCHAAPKKIEIFFKSPDLFNFLLQTWVHLITDVCSGSRQVILHTNLRHQLIQPSLKRTIDTTELEKIHLIQCIIYQFFPQVHTILALFVTSPKLKKINRHILDTKFCVHNIFLTLPYTFPLDSLPWWSMITLCRSTELLMPSRDTHVCHRFLREDYVKVYFKAF
jgi:hypothetical protein